jgi:hypothetical protein
MAHSHQLLSSCYSALVNRARLTPYGCAAVTSCWVGKLPAHFNGVTENYATSSEHDAALGAA